MKKPSLKTKAIFFALVFIALVSTFYWVIIRFSMQNAGLEDLKMISTEEAYEIIAANTGNPEFEIIDLRTHREYYDGHIENAKLLSYTDDDFEAQFHALDTANVYLVYCWKGRKTKRVRAMMKKRGFSKAWFMSGGYREWVDEGYPVTEATRQPTNYQR